MNTDVITPEELLSSHVVKRHRSQKKVVSLIVPFFNESDSVDIFFHKIISIINRIDHVLFEVICVDDGSEDDTLFKLTTLLYIDDRFKVIELSRNFGKEAALMAGIDTALGDAIIPIDADLQDPPELIGRFISEWEQGVDVVLGVRVERASDSFMKRKTAELFYWIHNKLSRIKIPQNAGDFRLMDRTVIEALKAMPENQLFMKGLFAWVGFKTTTVEFSRNMRIAGKSKFSGWKLWNLALEGITSFSTTPLKIWTYLGSLGTLFTLIYTGYVLLSSALRGTVIPSYASLLITILFFGSIQLISIGILGEYIGRIYMESKQRPRYLIRHHYGKKIKK